MRDRRGTVARVSGIAEDLTAAVRRRQRDREPRVVLYGPDAEARLIAPGAPGHEPLVEAAERMLALVASVEGGGGNGRPPPARRRDPGP